MITVYDLRHKGFYPVTINRMLDLDLRAEHEIFNLELHAILVARFTAVLCFNGIGDDTPQEMIAIDLTPGSDYKELWRDMIHDWGQFQLMRLFGKEVYKFDLLNNHIEVHDVRTYDKLSVLKLVVEMRYPHGEIAGDGRHLAIPGKMSEDNSPAVCVWNVRRKTRKFLLPTSSFCPFRWFEKVAVSKGRVFGLLNRRCLFGWDAESGQSLIKINLCESHPGQEESLPTYTYLSVYNNLFATIHPDLNCQIVYKIEQKAGEDEDSDDVDLSVVLPRLNLNWLKTAFGCGQVDARVCDVKLNDKCIIIQMLNRKTQSFEAILIRLDMGPINNQLLLENVSKSSIALESTGSHIPSRLFLTPTKLLNFAHHQVYVYDFL